MRGGAARKLGLEQGASFEESFRTRLVVIGGPGRGREIELKSARLLLGRSEDADVVLSDDSLSKLHTLFLRTSHGHQIQDLESANGTWLNGVRTEIAELEPDDRIAVGEHLLQYVVERIDG
jgi:pSer/pThr/pTyr-binding forkhead associated (FHA) protein